MVKMETETKLCTHRNFISALLYTTSAHCYNFFFSEVLAQETGWKLSQATGFLEISEFVYIPDSL